MDKKLRNKAKKIASRPYTVEVVLDETTDGRPVYVAETPELGGCFGQGETIDDAVKSLSEARVDYIQSLLEDDLPIPTPSILATTTSASLTFTLTLKYRQNDTVNLSDTKQDYEQSEKTLRLLYEGAIRA
jgi:predicted RNase H-like HicB family nuclease